MMPRQIYLSTISYSIPNYIQHSCFLSYTKVHHTRVVSLSLNKMSELLGSQDSKPVSDCHPSPKYHLCEPSPDVLTSIIENQRAFRLATKRMTEIEIISEDFCENHPAHDSDIQIKIDRLEKLSPLLEELMHLCTKLTNLLKERLENPEIHIAIGKLSDSELNRAYASLKQNPNRQMRRELAQNSQDRDDCFCSSGRLLESSKVDNMNDKLGQSPPSYDMAASVRKASDSATSKPARRFWKKFWRCLARL
jgi:hypothetical protein